MSRNQDKVTVYKTACETAFKVITLYSDSRQEVIDPRIAMKHDAKSMQTSKEDKESLFHKANSTLK